MGDRILFRENNRDLGVMNGTFGTLKIANNGHFHVALDNGTKVSFSPSQYSHFQLGYATTVHKSQGVAVDQSFVLATPHFNRHTGYVALSRHKQGVKLYASKEDFKTSSRLHQFLGKQGEKLSTLDFTDARQPQYVPEHDAPLSIFQRIRQYLGFEAKPCPSEQTSPEHQLSGSWVKDPEPSTKRGEKHEQTRSLDKQEFVKLREEFSQKAKIAEAQHTVEQSLQPEHINKLER